MSLTLDVAWVPDEVAQVVRTPDAAIVIDVVRATTSITTALASGADSVAPAATVDEARAMAAEGGALLCGEREGVPPSGFDYGNSPRDYSYDNVSGRSLVFTTTNGTRAMRRAVDTGARDTLLACFRNAGSVAATLDGLLDGRETPYVLIVCAGRKGRVSMDDAWCAGHLVGRLARPDTSLTDAAQAAFLLAGRLGLPDADGLARFAAGDALTRIGLRADLEVCASVDDLRVTPVMKDGVFVKGGEEEGI